MDLPRQPTRSELLPLATAMREAAIELLENIAQIDETPSFEEADAVERMQLIVGELGVVEALLAV